jgi:hypothetical protein
MIYTDAFILYEYHGNNGFWIWWWSGGVKDPPCSCFVGAFLLVLVYSLSGYARKYEYISRTFTEHSISWGQERAYHRKLTVTVNTVHAKEQ